MELVAAIFGAVAVFLIVRVSLSLSNDSVGRLQPQEKNLLTRLAPLISPVAMVTRGLLWDGYRRWIQRKLDAAGLSAYITADEFFALRFVLVALAWLLTMPYPLAFRVAFIILGAIFPEAWVLSAIRQRHAEIQRTLPYYTDLLSLCTSAGLDLGSAIERVIAHTDKGPLREEFMLMRRDVALGMSQQDALDSMSRRIQMPEMTSFCAILVQAIRMGATVGNILEAQAEKMRIERYEKAERLGVEAQHKILLPLLFLILPAYILLGMVPVVMAMASPIIKGGLFGGGP